MKRFSNSGARPRNESLSSPSSTRWRAYRASPLLEFPPRQAVKCLDILLSGALDHDLGQGGNRRLFVPADLFEVIAHVLLVETGLRPPGWYWSRGHSATSRRHHLVDEQHASVGQQSEPNLVSARMIPARLGVRDPEGVELQCDCLQSRHEVGADRTPRLRLADVDVVSLCAFVAGVKIGRAGDQIHVKPAGSGIPQTETVAKYSFQPEPDRYPRATHSTGIGSVRRTSIDRPRSASEARPVTRDIGARRW